MANTAKPKKTSNQARSYARKRAVQCLYQWQLNPNTSKEIIDEFNATQEMERVDPDYFQQLVQETISKIDVLDESIKKYIELDIEKLDPIELTILRLAFYETTDRIEIPYKVIIDEAINLTKTFGGEQGHAFVNAVLDKAMLDLRPLETKK